MQAEFVLSMLLLYDLLWVICDTDAYTSSFLLRMVNFKTVVDGRVCKNIIIPTGAYWKQLGKDYSEVVSDTIQEAKDRPLKASVAMFGKCPPKMP